MSVSFATYGCCHSWAIFSAPKIDVSTILYIERKNNNKKGCLGGSWGGGSIKNTCPINLIIVNLRISYCKL